MDNMDQLASLLAPILNDPEAMSGIMQAASQLGLGDMLSGSFGQDSEQNKTEQPQYPDEQHGHGAQHSPDNSNTSDKANTGDILSRLLPLFSSTGNQNDTTRLLSALKPFLHGERAKRLDDAQKLIKLLGIVNTLRQQGLM